MAKRRLRPDLSGAQSWLSHWATAEGIDFERMSLAQAADRAVSLLEQQREVGLPLRSETVRLAALLVRMEGEMVVAGASSPQPFIERAYALDRARLLGERHAAGQRIWTRPAISFLEPEPEPEAEPTTLMSLYDFIRTCESLIDYYKQRQGRL